MNVDGVEVLVEGNGPEAIVMVHGWPDTYRLWDRQVEALRGCYRCVRFTLPGFESGSPRRAHSLDEVTATIRAIVARACPGERVTLLLHDWGCVFGYYFAQSHPELVRRVIGVDVGDAGSRTHSRSLGLGAKAAIFAYQVWLAAAWRIGGRPGDAMARAMARLLRWPGDPARVGAQMGYPYYLQWSGALGGFRKAKVFVPACPMLFVYGRRKPFMFHSAPWAGALAARPGCRVAAFATGHWVMVEAPRDFDRTVASWLAQGDAPR